MSNLIVLRSKLIHDAEDALLGIDQQGRLLTIMREKIPGADILQVITITEEDGQLADYSYDVYYYDDWIPISSPEPVPLRFRIGPVISERNGKNMRDAAEHCLELHHECGNQILMKRNIER